MQSVQFTLALQSREAVPAQGLIEDHSHGIGQVQGTDPVTHGNADAGLLIIYKDFLGNSRALFAEHDIVIRPEIRLGVQLSCLRCGKPDAMICFSTSTSEIEPML